MKRESNKALDILMNVELTTLGCKWNISDDDFEYAKKEGYMFDYPNYETHDEVLEKLHKLLPKINCTDVANAFLYSLSTRKLEYRSALGSYYYAISIPNHKLNENYHYDERLKSHCYICGWLAWEKNKYTYDGGLNSFNRTRYKYGGGLGNTYLDYALFDLEQFLKLPKVIPSENDKNILKEIIMCANDLNPKDKAGKLRDVILNKKIIKCNKYEVGALLDILGICGIFESKEFPPYYKEFVGEFDRSPIEHKNDFAYPINRWYASDGVNKDNIKKIFNMNID